MEIKRVGVIGAGQMGNGIAHVFALAGYDVHLHDVSETALTKAPEIIGANMERQVAREKITEADRQAALGRIALEFDLAKLGPTDLVIEAATEREDLKHRIFADLVPHLADSRRSSPRTPRRSRSPGSPPPPTAPSGSWASIS